MLQRPPSAWRRTPASPLTGRARSRNAALDNKRAAYYNNDRRGAADNRWALRLSYKEVTATEWTLGRLLLFCNLDNQIDDRYDQYAELEQL